MSNQIIIPEITLFKILETIIKFIEIDFNNTTDENKTMLFKIFGDNQVGKFNFYEQAKDIFLRDNAHPRQIAVRMMFDAQRANLPTIHISLPSESPGADGIGVDEGYQENDVDTENRTVNKTYTRMFDTQYNCIISSDNSTEVLLIYHLLKSMLIGIFDTMEFSGLRNPKLSGQDLQINSDIVPPHIFTRGVGISCSYEQTVSNVQQEKFIETFKLIHSIS
jgi:hypothetical protein